MRQVYQNTRNTLDEYTMNIDPCLYAIANLGDIDKEALYHAAEHSLVLAIKKGDTAMVNQILDQKVNIHWRGESALMAAVAMGRIDIVNRLIELGANVRTSSDAPLRLAVRLNLAGMVFILARLSLPKTVQEIYNRLDVGERIKKAIVSSYTQAPETVKDIFETMQNTMDKLNKEEKEGVLLF